MPSRQTMLEKAEKVEEISSLMRKYKVIGAASLQKVRTDRLQEIKRKLEKSVYIRVSKKNIMKRAIDKNKNRPNLKQLKEYLSGPNIFLFSDLNPFKLVLLLKKNTVTTIARAGDIAAHDIVVPSRNTGLPPGPIISQLNTVGLPTRIESGSVWITRDTLVAKKGEFIPARLAAALSKLGINSTEVGLNMKVVYDDGTIITEEKMRLDLEKTRKSLVDAHLHALVLSLNTSYPVSENIAMLLQTAHHEALKLALNANILTRETIIILIRTAHMEMLSMSRVLNRNASNLVQKS